MRAAFWARATTALLIWLGSGGWACDDGAKASAAPDASGAVPAAADPCPGDRSLDPSAAATAPARKAFDGGDYDRAAQLLDALIAEHPYSATLQLLRADAALYAGKASEGEADYVAAADRALPLFERAAALHDRGCRLRERDDYYLRMGMAYAHLRKRDARRARVVLETAWQKWPTSPEISYHLARTYCLEADVAECVRHFETTLDLARALQRPRFLRTHHSVDDWIRRSHTQSEFGPLRGSPRYRQLVRHRAR